MHSFHETGVMVLKSTHEDGDQARVILRPLFVLIACMIFVPAWFISATGYFRQLLTSGPILFGVPLLLFVIFYGRRRDQRVGRVAALAVCVGFLLGVGSGYGVRLVHCWRLQDRLASVAELLDAYRARHGSYPASLSDLDMPDPKDMGIREGHFAKEGFVLDHLADAQSIVYLAPERYLFVLPVSKRSGLSFGALARLTLICCARVMRVGLVSVWCIVGGSEAESRSRCSLRDSW